MRKIFLYILLFMFFGSTFAMNPADSLNKIPENFREECYEYSNVIDKSEIWNNDKGEKYMTYKVDIDKIEDLVITQYNFILPFKFYSTEGNNYSYSNNLWINNKYLLDFNINTYKEINSKTQNEIILSFDEILEKKNFSFTFNYSSSNYLPEYYISDDKINWNLIKKQDIETFGFKYLKIKFISKSDKQYLENIKIYELNFTKKSNTILIKSFFSENINIYSKYNCKDKQNNTKALFYNNFSINKDTKQININSTKNIKYNVFKKSDQDNDGVQDKNDNCIYISNSKQIDSNGDNIGDMCSDDDNDGIIGHKDNCINTSNKDQKDINRNGVGDVCEFDKDLDGIFDQVDNCIYIKNENQEDIDKDGIGDVCDNCKSYNPNQADTNNNKIGDICEQNDKYLLENDDDKDGILNNKDNCKDEPNPNQYDHDEDGIGDSCDNCKKIQNTNQLDFNKNSIGDICEDSDLDGIEGLTDNCINIANPDQKDTDNDGVGDVCEDDDGDNIIAQNDNCPFIYNPEQIDIDKDNLGDKCDKKDDRYIESNSNFFIGLIILVTFGFFFGIYMMIRKLK